MVVFGITFIRSAEASKRWPVAQGSVVSTRARLQSSSTGNSSPSSYSYAFEVTYAYEVDGEQYEGDRFSLGEGSTASRAFPERSDAQVAASRDYPTGSEVDVYYDPENPASAVLKPGANWGTYMPLVLGTVFLCSGVGTVWWMQHLANQTVS